MRLDSNGETHVSPTPYGGDYRMTFGGVPSGGSWATAWVDCSVTNDYTRRVFISRPPIGIDLPVSLK